MATSPTNCTTEDHANSVLKKTFIPPVNMSTKVSAGSKSSLTGENPALVVEEMQAGRPTYTGSYKPVGTGAYQVSTCSTWNFDITFDYHVFTPKKLCFEFHHPDFDWGLSRLNSVNREAGEHPIVLLSGNCDAPFPLSSVGSVIFLVTHANFISWFVLYGIGEFKFPLSAVLRAEVAVAPDVPIIKAPRRRSVVCRQVFM